MFALSSVIAKRPQPSRVAREHVLKLVAFAIVTSPAAAVAYLFVVNPEALGAPIVKLLLMLAAWCLLMTAGSSSRALVTWAAARSDVRSLAPPPAEAERSGLLGA